MKLVIVPTTEPRQKLLETTQPIELTTDILSSRSEVELEKYGQSWAKFWKTDIVMLVDG